MNAIFKPQKPLWKRIFRKIHLWLGLTIILPLIIIAITGIILAVLFLIREIQNNTSHSQNYIATPVEIGQIINISNGYEKDDFRVNSIRMPEKTTGEITVSFINKKNGNIMRIILEPVSLRIIKTEYGDSFEKIILNLHSSFLTDDAKTVVGFIGIALCVICISGIIIWIPRHGNMKNSSVPKFSLRGRALYINLHKSFGIWCSLFLIVIGFTGTSLVFTKQFQYIISRFSYVKDFKNIPKSETYKNINIENIAMNAIKAVQNNGITSIQIPQKIDNPYRIMFRKNENERYKISVFVGNDGGILEIRDPNNYSSGEKLMMWLGFIHKGNGMGILWRILQIFFGGIILLFTVTGLLIWLKKKNIKRDNKI